MSFHRYAYKKTASRLEKTVGSLIEVRSKRISDKDREEVWLFSFMDYDLGFFDRTLNRVEPVGENPLASKVLPMSSE